jgi:hypothetical protein
MNVLQRQSRFERGDDVVVMKFGGTSVEDEAAIRRLIGIVRNKRSTLGVRPVVVVSALARVSWRCGSMRPSRLRSGYSAGHLCSPRTTG